MNINGWIYVPRGTLIHLNTLYATFDFQNQYFSLSVLKVFTQPELLFHIGATNTGI